VRATKHERAEVSYDSRHAGDREPEFSQISTPVLRRFAALRKAMPGRETLISSAFVTYTGLGWFRNRVRASSEFGRCFASNKSIARLMGQSEATVKRNKKKLEEWRLIFIEGRPGFSGYTYFVDDPAEFDAIAKAHGRGAAERAIVMAIDDETNQAHREIAAATAKRSQTSGEPSSQVSYPQVTGDLPPSSPVKDTWVTRELRTEDRTEGFNTEGNRAPSSDGVRPLSERTYPNNAPHAAEIVGRLQQLAAEKTMPPARMTPAEEDARRQELWRQVDAHPRRSRGPYTPSTGEEWEQKVREARAKAAKMLKDQREERAARPAAHCQETR